MAQIQSTSSGSPHTNEIPKMCKAGVVVNEGPNFHVEVTMVPVPEPKPDELLIRLSCTGVCYSDIHYMSGDLGRPPMSSYGIRSAGHEGAGVIVKLGSNVKESEWKVGDRVGIKPMWYVCGKCEVCWEGREQYCTKKVNAGCTVTGSFQQYMTSPASYTQPIPDGVDDYTAGPLMCSGSTMYRSIISSGLRAGDFAVFPGGGGGVGIQGVQLAHAMGMRSIVIDSGAEKKELCMKRGAEAFVDFREVGDTVGEIVRLCDGVGAHGVFVTAAAAYKDAVAYVGKRVGASVMCIGIPPVGTVTVGAGPEKFVIQNLKIQGTLVGSRADIAKTLDFARRGVLQAAHTAVYPIDRLSEAVEKVRKGEAAGRSIVDFNL